MIKITSTLSLAEEIGVYRLAMQAFGDDNIYMQKLCRAVRDDGGRFVLYKENSETLGFCMLEPIYYFDRARRLCGNYIYDFCVDKAFRGRGIGSEILASALKSGGDFALIVPSDERLYAAYRRRGFDIDLCGCAKTGGGQFASLSKGNAAAFFDVSRTDHKRITDAARAFGGIVTEKNFFDFFVSDCKINFAFSAAGGAIGYTDGRENPAAAYGVSPENTTARKAQMKMLIDYNPDAFGIYADILGEF